jgi:peptidoglycan/LPS O-acetylase OafA/YrhL
VTTVLEQYRRKSRRRRRQAEPSRQRLDIQGLRMVAVLLVFATHLCRWPQGGFIGVDVFFVISGFLITGNLLRMAESSGNVSFRKFYWNRVRRIVPAATLVLVLTCALSAPVFLPFRAHHVGVDASFAFIFMSNWWFAVQETDYFAAGDAVSPIQHYWSLSIEEQFYFVWPALIFVLGLLIARKAWTHSHRMRLAGAVMGGIIAASLGWALYETATSPTWAYFNTFTRMWELGVGAFLATSVGALARIPVNVKPWLSWAGLGLIAASVVLIAEASVGFPAPWALLPVAGSAMVIAAGAEGEPTHLGILRNPVSVYIGNISYSLYLVHWPVIVILGALMAPHGGSFYLAALALSFGLAIASYHFVENPLRYSNRGKAREKIREIRRVRFGPQRSTQYAVMAVLALLMVGFTAYTMRPPAHHPVQPEVAAPRTVGQSRPTAPKLGPLASALQDQIVEALKATEWPRLDPSMESVIKDFMGVPDTGRCGSIDPPSAQACTWGSPSAPIRVVLVGDSVAVNYAGPLRELALNSGGGIQLHIEAMSGCQFSNDWIYIPDHPDWSVVDACPARKQHTVDVINDTKPDVVIIADWYGPRRRVGSDQWMTSGEWADSMRQIVDKFRRSTKKVVWLSAPPADKNISECYGNRSSVPADCISRVTSQWLSIADADQGVAKTLGGVWIDSRPWFCSQDGACPAFVGSTPTKHDVGHMSTAYGEKIYPVIGESFTAAGVF